MDSDDESSTLSYKLILLGDGTTGKTSICNIYISEVFNKSYKQTIGCDFYNKNLNIAKQNINLQIWDIGGQTLGSKMISKYIYGANCICLIYDITNYESFQNIQDWYDIIIKTLSKENLPLICLVGNKNDLSHIRTIKPESHTSFVELYNLSSYFVSAKTGENINSMFYKIAADLANISITKAEIDANSKVISAPIINHQQHDPTLPTKPIREEESNMCIIN